jgi:hypothetical protein
MTIVESFYIFFTGLLVTVILVLVYGNVGPGSNFLASIRVRSNENSRRRLSHPREEEAQSDRSLEFLILFSLAMIALVIVSLSF